jgi:PAS domain-containing protein
MEQTKETIDELRQKIGALETERKQAEQTALEANASLQETQRCLTRLIESSPDAIISTDKQGNVVLFSEGAETLWGYRAKEVTSGNISVLYGDEAGPKQIARETRKRGGGRRADRRALAGGPDAAEAGRTDRARIRRPRSAKDV